MLHMVCLNLRKTYGDLLDDVLGSVPHRLTFHAPPDGSLNGPASSPLSGGTYATLRGFMETRVAGWQGYEPLVLLSRTDGNRFVRRWLRHEEDRELVSALVLVDALHGAPAPGTQFDDEFSGVVEFARDCLADPGEKLLLALSESIQAGSAHCVGFGALLRHAVWSSAPEGEIVDTHWAENIEILDLPDLGTEELPSPAVALLRSRLVPFATELGPASAPEQPLA
jgi:hypothetical protein